MYPENLMSISQNFQTNEIVGAFSRALGESLDKTRIGLRSVIPTLIVGIVNKSQVELGPETLVNLVNKDGVDMQQVNNLGNEHMASLGTDAIYGLFGNNLDSVAASIGQNVKIETPTVKKMMGLAAPLVMGLIGSKMRGEGMSTPGLMGFLGQQRHILAATYSMQEANPRVKVPAQDSLWFTLLMVGVLITALVWWSTGVN